MDSSKILYIKNEQYFLFDGEKFTNSTSVASKKYHVALLVPPSSLFIYSSKLPSSLDDDGVELQMDIAMHEEGGADEEQEYSISTIRHSLPNEDSDLVDLFAITKNQADALYGEIAKKTKAIDIMAPSFLIYKSLYTIEDAPSTDLYMYFGDEEAYGVLFRDGKYIAYRIMDNLANLCGQTNLDFETVKALLKTKGVLDSNYAPEELDVLTSVQDYMTKGIERIVHTINHKRGLFGLEGVDRIYIDFEGEVVPGLENIFEAFGLENFTIHPLKAHDNEDPLLHHDIIAGDYLLGVINNKFKSVNLSPYERELPLYKQPAGYFLGIVFICLLLIGIGWYFLQMQIDNENAKLAALDLKIKQSNNRVTLANTKIKKLEKELVLVNTKLDNAQKENEKLEQTNIAISIFQSSSAKRSQIVDDALMGLSQNGLGTKKIDQNGTKSLSLYIVTTPNKQSNIANFMNFMTQKGYQRSYTKQIVRNDSLYESVVEIIR